MTEASDPGFGWAVRGLVEQGERLFSLARHQAYTIADRLDTRAYTADVLAEDLSRSTARLVQGWVALAGELLAASAVLTQPPVDEPVTSAWFPVGEDPPSTLSLAGDLQPVFGPQRLERFPPIRRTQVTIETDPPGTGPKRFRLSVRPRGVRGITYLGVVEVRRHPQSSALRSIEVDIQVP